MLARTLGVLVLLFVCRDHGCEGKRRDRPTAFVEIGPSRMVVRESERKDSKPVVCRNRCHVEVVSSTCDMWRRCNGTCEMIERSRRFFGSGCTVERACPYRPGTNVDLLFNCFKWYPLGLGAIYLL